MTTGPFDSSHNDPRHSDPLKRGIGAAKLPAAIRAPDDPESGEAAEQLQESRATQQSTHVWDSVGDDLPTDETRRALSDYDLLAEIARGGMGIVYKARDRQLNRLVAVKVTRAGQFASDSERKRFLGEAAAAAQLDHPHIVPIFEVGEAGGGNFFSMAFVEGESLAQAVKSGPLPPRRAAELIKLVAEAVGYAHSRGVVHRDLKPGNILVDESGQPRVTDFGLAKRTDGDSSLTQIGQVVGTPSYMPPEQAEGRNDQVGELADVYSLGATLYCLLTGRPPFQGASMVETLGQVVAKEPVALRMLNPAVDRDLETIVLKCLEKRPEKRYESAIAVADDLARFLDGRHILARPVDGLEKVARWCRRNPAVASLLGVIGVVFLAAFVLVTWSYMRAENAFREEARQRAAAEQAMAAAKRERSAERWERYRANIVAATSALQLHNVRAVRNALGAAPVEHRDSWEWKHLYHQLDAAQHAVQMESYVGSMSTSHSHDMIAALATPASIRVWNFANREKIATIPFESPRYWTATSRDGKWIAYSNVENSIMLWSVASRQRHAQLQGHAGPVNHGSFSPDGSILASCSEDGTIRTWEVPSGRPLRVFRGHECGIHSVEFSADGRQLVSAGRDDRAVRLWDVETGESTAVLRRPGKVIHHAKINNQASRVIAWEGFPSFELPLWNAQTGELVSVLRGHINTVVSAQFSPDGGRIATCGDRTVRLWDARTGAPQAVIRGHQGLVNKLAFNADGTRIATVSHDQTVRLWDAATGAQLAVLHGHTSDVRDITYLPDGNTIVSVTGEGCLRWWDAGHAERSSVLRGHTNFVYGAAFHPDGERAASCAWDGTIRLWNATSGRQLAILRYPTETPVTSVAFHPSGRQLASVGRDDMVRLWDVDRGGELHQFSVPTNTYYDTRVAFSRDGVLMACGSKDYAVYVWNVASRERVAVLRGHTDVVREVVFAPDASWIASAGETADRTIRVWDLADKQPLRVIEAHAEKVYALAGSRDGKWLASGSADGSVRLWDTATWQEQAVLNHGTEVYGVAFTPDGKRLAVACANNTIQLWDVKTHKQVGQLIGHEAYVHQVAFSPDGTRLISASGDFTLRIWDTLPIQQRMRRSGPKP